MEYTNTTASAFVSSVSHHFHAGGDNLEAGYTGGETRAELKNRDIDWQVATKRSKLKAVPRESKLGALLSRLESVKASIRSKVEHPFHIVKNLFSHRKVRYKGLKKNTAQWHILFALANLVIAKRPALQRGPWEGSGSEGKPSVLSRAERLGEVMTVGVRV
ncbi:MAG: transposase [Candidatus Accumulibacter sp.]|nr:transposase [Accumulibacter sp.]